MTQKKKPTKKEKDKTLYNKTFTLLKVDKNHPYYNECLNLSTISKQLYNVGLYALRQSLIFNGVFLANTEVYALMKENENWIELPRKISNQVWKQSTGAWSSWLKSLRKFTADPTGYTGRPRIPRYKQVTNCLTYPQDALNLKSSPKGFIKLSQTNIVLDISKVPGEIVEVKILPRKDSFIIKATYKLKKEKKQLNKKRIAGIDLGVNNLIAVATNQVDIQHILISGRKLKSINNYWNKQVAKLQKQLPQGQFTSKRIAKLTEKRNNVIDTMLHRISFYVVKWLVDNKIGTLIIGKNNGWKNKINLGAKNNQKFVNIPHSRLIDLITYKYEAFYGKVILTEESYTSRCSALDLEVLRKYKKPKVVDENTTGEAKEAVKVVKKKPDVKRKPFVGNRIYRGLFKTATGIKINADINGALNIIRKASKKSLDNLVSDKQFILNCTTPLRVKTQF